MFKNFQQLVTGSRRVKKESIVAHVKSVCHQRAKDAKEAANKAVNPLEKSFQHADEKTLEKMDKLFRTTYYLVKQVPKSYNVTTLFNHFLT
jgi:hypothetical protein